MTAPPLPPRAKGHADAHGVFLLGPQCDGEDEREAWTALLSRATPIFRRWGVGNGECVRWAIPTAAVNLTNLIRLLGGDADRDHKPTSRPQHQDGGAQ